MIRARVFISGIEYNDFTELGVEKSASENYVSSNYNITLDNPYGRHKTDFTVGNEIKIFGDPTNGLRSYYRLNDGTGSVLTDYFGQVNGSIVSGLEARWVQGKLGSAYQLGSPSYMEQSGLNPSKFDKLSVAFWVKPTQWNTNDRLVDQQNTGPEHGFTFVQSVGAGSISFAIRSGTTTMATLITKLPNGEWSHIVGTQDNINQRSQIYRNGQLIQSDNSSYMSQTTGDLRLNIGRRANSNANFFSGIVDDLRFYDSILSQADVNKLYAGGSGYEDTYLLTGIVEKIRFDGEENYQTVSLSGRDYSARLMDSNVEPSVYTNTEIGSIVRNIIYNNTTDIGSSRIGTTATTLKRIAFNQQPVYDAVKQLADLSAYNFYMDSDKNLVFEPAGSVATSIIFNSGNIVRMNFDKTREGMANKIWVYGDRYLSQAPREVFISDGVGSIHTLLYNPHNSEVRTSLSAGSILKGAILGMQSITSGIDYFVNYEDKQIVLVSGTDIGYTQIPPNNGSIVVDYSRSLPIVKFGENRASEKAFGPKTKVINDKSIKDPATAINILNNELAKSDPFDNISFTTKGWYYINPGETAKIVAPDFNLNKSNIPVISMSYRFNPQTAHSEEVISLIMDKREIDLTDKIREINNRLNALESQDKQNSDVITRLEYATGSALAVGSYWSLGMKWNGSEFRVWGSNNVAPLGSNFTPVLGLLVSGDISHSSWVGSVSYLASGIFGTPLEIFRSGGFYF